MVSENTILPLSIILISLHNTCTSERTCEEKITARSAAISLISAPHLDDLVRVQSIGGLVQHHQLRPMDDRLSNAHPLPVAAR